MRHLDTNAVVVCLRGNQAVAERIKEALPDVEISSLVLAELLFGARISARAEANVEAVRAFVSAIRVVDFDAASAEAYSRIRATLRRKGRTTGEIDALIASVAVASGATLVTHNTKDFEHIDELTLEDWQE